MTRRHHHQALALFMLSAVACSDDSESSDTNAQSTDAGADASADSRPEKPARGRDDDESAASGRGGRGEAGKGGKGGARDSGAREEEEGDEEEDKGESTPDAPDGAGGTAGNSTAAGAGGTAGTPTAGASGGAAGTSPGNDEDAGVPDQQGPHFKSTTLQGHMWLAQSGEGTTLTATGFDAAVVSGPVCIQGSVVATPDYNSNAALGLNLNQLPNEAPMPFTPTLAGLQIDVTNRAGSPLRILIQSQDGSGLWCASVNGSGGFIAWTDFNTACWDGSGTAYALQPLAVASVQVSGGIDAAIPYDFCLNGLTETAAPAAPTTPAPVQPAANPN